MESRLSVVASVRHKWPDRLFHWGMAVTVIILLISAFFPIIGIQFDWVPWHWISGVILGLLVLFHILRALSVQGLSNMLPRAYDFRRGGYAACGDAKYDIFQKSFHWGMAVIVLTLIATGIPMLIKLDTLFWDRNPALLTDVQWGYVYVFHGLASLALIFMVILHIYFSLLPEHKKLLVAMLTGKGPIHVEHDS